MPKYRIEYGKVDQARFLSHLELQRTFNRAFRRARLPLAFTQGFNPHPKISFGPPLMVGVAGLHEYLDIELEREIPVQASLVEITSTLPDGLDARNLVALPDSAPGLGKAVDSAWYRVNIPADRITAAALQQVIGQLVSPSEQWFYKRERDGKIFDVKSGVIAGRIISENGFYCLDLLVRIGTGEVPLRGLLNVIWEKAAVSDKQHLYRVTRAGLYKRQEEVLVTPLGEIKRVWEE